jgi:hypothetical protein
MVTLIIFGEIVVIWDSNEDGKVQIGSGKCKDPSLDLSMMLVEWKTI